MRKGDYIIAIKTIIGECEVDRRYKIGSIRQKGENIRTIEFFPVIL
jgi:hypothetical protein